MTKPGRTAAPLGLLFMLCLAGPARGEWDAVNIADDGASGETTVAYTENADGYTLEIYKDSVNAIRSRLTLPNGLLSFAERTCPTFQVDRRTPRNRSVNNAPCLSDTGWSEFILGYVQNNHVRSAQLLSIMNGINMVFRFRLENGDYYSTSFSLQGSRRALFQVLGEDVTISAN